LKNFLIVPLKAMTCPSFVKSEATSARSGEKLIPRLATETVGPPIFQLCLAPPQKGTSAACSHTGEVVKNAKTDFIQVARIGSSRGHKMKLKLLKG
jgi:hypothetical protein